MKPKKVAYPSFLVHKWAPKVVKDVMCPARIPSWAREAPSGRATGSGRARPPPRARALPGLALLAGGEVDMELDPEDAAMEAALEERIPQRDN
jgi:hypothetical protein